MFFRVECFGMHWLWALRSQNKLSVYYRADKHSRTLGQYQKANLFVSGWWEAVFGENPCRHRKNIQTPHRRSKKTQILYSSKEPSSFGSEVLFILHEDRVLLLSLTLPPHLPSPAAKSLSSFSWFPVSLTNSSHLRFDTHFSADNLSPLQFFSSRPCWRAGLPQTSWPLAWKESYTGTGKLSRSAFGWSQTPSLHPKAILLPSQK